MTSLMLENDAATTSRNDLALIPTPEATETWQPIPHSDVVDVAESTLNRHGFEIIDSAFGIKGDDGAQMFATLDLQSKINAEVRVAVGLANSTDKTLSAKFCAGERVLVCSNLCFGGEVDIAAKHTLNGREMFETRIDAAVAGLEPFIMASTQRIARLSGRIIDRDEANSIMLRAFESGLISSRQLMPLVNEWRNPKHEDFEPRTLWSLQNAYTEIMKPRQASQPAKAARESMAFQRFLTAV